MRAKGGVNKPYLARKGYKVISHLQTPDLQALIGSTTPFLDPATERGHVQPGARKGALLMRRMSLA